MTTTTEGMIDATRDMMTTTDDLEGIVDLHHVNVAKTTDASRMRATRSTRQHRLTSTCKKGPATTADPPMGALTTTKRVRINPLRAAAQTTKVDSGDVMRREGLVIVAVHLHPTEGIVATLDVTEDHHLDQSDRMTHHRVLHNKQTVPKGDHQEMHRHRMSGIHSSPKAHIHQPTRYQRDHHGQEGYPR